MKPETTIAIANREVKKGDVLAVARIAGIQAAKRTADMLVPAPNLTFTCAVVPAAVWNRAVVPS